MKKIAKAKAKAATVKRMGHSPQSYFHDRPRSLPLIEQRLKRELAAKLAARKARQYLQNSRKRKQKDDVLIPKPEIPDDLPEFVTESKDTVEEDIYENSQPEGYYLVPMSQDDSSSEDSSPEAEYATINHGNKAVITPGAMIDSPPPPPPPPIQSPLQLQPPCPPPPDMIKESLNNNDIYEETPNAAILLANGKQEKRISAKLTSPIEKVASIKYEVRPKLVKTVSENSEGIYENDTDLRLSVCKFASDDFGHFYENLEERVQNEFNLKEDEIPDIPPVNNQVILDEDEIPDIPEFVEIERFVEGATDDSKDRSGSTSIQSVRSFGATDDSQDRSGSASMQSVRSFGSSEMNTPASASGTDESMSAEDAEEMELPTENVVTENILWSKGVKVCQQFKISF